MVKTKKTSSLITFDNLRAVLRSKKISENNAEQVFNTTKKAKAIARLVGVHSRSFSRGYQKNMIKVWNKGIAVEKQNEKQCPNTIKE